MVGLAFGGTNFPRTINEAYPGLFSTDEEEDKKKQEIVFKQRMLAYADAHNKRFKKRG